MFRPFKVLSANSNNGSGVLIEPPLLAKIARAKCQPWTVQHQPHARLEILKVCGFSWVGKGSRSSLLRDQFKWDSLAVWIGYVTGEEFPCRCKSFIFEEFIELFPL